MKKETSKARTKKNMQVTFNDKQQKKEKIKMQKKPRELAKMYREGKLELVAKVKFWFGIDQDIFRPDLIISLDDPFAVIYREVKK